MSRHVYLVRHGETEGESSIRYHGRNDVALSELGHQQVGRLVPWLRELEFAAVVHSPLQRARTSAEVLLAGLDRPPALVESDPGLFEVNFGAIEGLTREEIRDRMPDWFAQWESGETDGFPDGETYAGFASRIAAAWDELVARHPVGDLLVVAHRGVIKRALTHCLQLDAAASAELVIELASLTVVRCGDRTELVSLDQVPPE